MMRVALLAGIFYASRALKLNTNSHNASALSSTLNSTVKHTNQEFIFDFGFFNGMDSWTYLQAGYRVVAVEADPSLVDAAKVNANFMPFLQSQQLQVLNLAIAPLEQNADSWLPFYLNSCTKEWNSFYSSIGCRSCTPPYPEDPSKTTCSQPKVLATPCASVFKQHGTPTYFKLDIEGAEAGCYHAMRNNEVYRPRYLSAEVGDDKLVDVLIGLGYQSFKLVRQKSGISGEWGDAAQDCRTAGLWRSQAGARQELQGIFTKGPAPNDPCPGANVGGNWYDLHASRLVHQTY
jgi:FkbM family methyltransferase